jgi:hypothetical protein
MPYTKVLGGRFFLMGNLEGITKKDIYQKHGYVAET